ncbi:Rho-type GTPase activating protein Rga1 [Oleoguttula sp. CCFEE 5521]
MGDVDESFLAIEAVHSLIECNESMCEVPEDLSFILNDSTLFSSSADITTKEILKRYGDRAKAPQINQNPTSLDLESPGGSRGGAGGGNAAMRVDGDISQSRAWGQESSVRAVAADGQGGGEGSPVRGTGPKGGWDGRGQTRVAGMA